MGGLEGHQDLSSACEFAINSLSTTMESGGSRVTRRAFSQPALQHDDPACQGPGRGPDWADTYPVAASGVL